MKYLLWISLIIAAIIVVNEIMWIGRSDLAWLFIGLGVAVGLQSIYLLAEKK